jgi:hypothetical protein
MGCQLLGNKKIKNKENGCFINEEIKSDHQIPD